MLKIWRKLSDKKDNLIKVWKKEQKKLNKIDKKGYYNKESKDRSCRSK